MRAASAAPPPRRTGRARRLQSSVRTPGCGKATSLFMKHKFKVTGMLDSKVVDQRKVEAVAVFKDADAAILKLIQHLETPLSDPLSTTITSRSKPAARSARRQRPLATAPDCGWERSRWTSRSEIGRCKWSAGKIAPFACRCRDPGRGRQQVRDAAPPAAFASAPRLRPARRLRRRPRRDGAGARDRHSQAQCHQGTASAAAGQ